MTHVASHWCGGAGDFVEEVSLIFRRHTALGVGVALKPHGFEDYGVDPKDIDKLREMIERDIQKWYKCCRKLGVPVHFYPPHPDNLK